MSIATEIDGTRIAQAVARRSWAEQTLAKTERSPNLFLVITNVVCISFTFAFVSIHVGVVFQALVGGVAGAAFALAAASYGECLRQRRRFEALLALTRIDGL